MKRTEEQFYSPNEEIFNVATHGLGLLLAFVAIPILLIKASQVENGSMLWGAAVFSFGVFMVYAASTFFHAIQHTQAKKALRVWDHISIFFMIGGSYTPFMLKYVESTTAMIFLTCMWLFIGLGSILKLFFTGKYDTLSTAVYVILGCAAIFVSRSLISNVPLDIFLWILGGGAAYLLGVVFYRWERLDYHHGIWHIFVMLGTATHYVAVYKTLNLL